MSPFPSLLQPQHPPNFGHPHHQLPHMATPQQRPQQQVPLTHRPLRFLAQILPPYDIPLLQHPNNQPHPQPYPLQPTTAQPTSHLNPLSLRRRSPQTQILAPDFDVRETAHAYFLEGEFPGVRDTSAVRLEWVDCRTLAIEAQVQRMELDEEWGDIIGEWWNTADAGIKSETAKCGTVVMEGSTTGTSSTTSEDIAMENTCGIDTAATTITTTFLPTPESDVPPPIYPDSIPDGGPLCREMELERRKMEELARLQQLRKRLVRDWLQERRVGRYQRTFTFPADVDALGVRARLGQGLLRILVPKVKGRGVGGRRVGVECVE